MTNLEYIKQASVQEIAIELACNQFETATQAKEWLEKDKEDKLILSFKEILDLEFYSQDWYRTMTVKEFLKKILSTYIREREEFSTKRPFGNSDWDSDLIILFIKKNIIKGKIDKYNSIEDFDFGQFNILLQNIVQEL